VTRVVGKGKDAMIEAPGEETIADMMVEAIAEMIAETIVGGVVVTEILRDAARHHGKPTAGRVITRGIREAAMVAAMIAVAVAAVSVALRLAATLHKIHSKAVDSGMQMIESPTVAKGDMRMSALRNGMPGTLTAGNLHGMRGTLTPVPTSVVKVRLSTATTLMKRR